MDKTIIKECPRHGLTEHILLTSGTYKCKECRKDAVIDIRRRNKIKLVEYKGGKCERCGYDKCIDALEFHHLNPDEKDFGVSCGDTRSLEKLKAEADKCIMVCANCHREIHAEERERKILERDEKKIENEITFFNNSAKNKRLQSRKLIKEKLILSEIVNDIDKKIPKKDIAKKYNVSAKVIKTFLKKNGVEYNEAINKNVTRKISIEDFIDKFRIYGSFTKVGKHYGVSDNAIKKWCERNGLPWRKKELVEYIEKK